MWYHYIILAFLIILLVACAIVLIGYFIWTVAHTVDDESTISFLSELANPKRKEKR